MVYAALFCPKAKENQLKEMECAGTINIIYISLIIISNQYKITKNNNRLKDIDRSGPRENLRQVARGE